MEPVFGQIHTAVEGFSDTLFNCKYILLLPNVVALGPVVIDCCRMLLVPARLRYTLDKRWCLHWST